jgi:hypothetical protein
MEPDFDRTRRVVGFTIFGVFAVTLVGGAVLLGRMVGDAIGAAYVGTVPSAADGLPMPPMPPPPPGPATEISSLPYRQGQPRVQNPKQAPAGKGALAKQNKKS